MICQSIFARMRLTVCVTCAGAGVDSVWEQKKPEARKMLENAADSHQIAAGIFVGRLSSTASMGSGETALRLRSVALRNGQVWVFVSPYHTGQPPSLSIIQHLYIIHSSPIWFRFGRSMTSFIGAYYTGNIAIPLDVVYEAGLEEILLAQEPVQSLNIGFEVESRWG